MARLEKVRSMLGELEGDALLIEHPLDLFYLTGLKLSLGQLIITPTDSTLYVDGRYFESASKRAPCTVILLERFKPDRGQKMAFDSATTSYKRFLELSSHYPHLIPCEEPIKKLRQIKEPEEIVLLQEASQLGFEGYHFVKSLLKEGVTEKEIATELEIYWKRHGGEGVAFEPIIAFGANSAYPHYRSGDVALKRGDVVLIDIGVMKKGYASDMTRCHFFGNVSPEIEKIYTVVEEAKNLACGLCKPNVKIADVDFVAREHIERKGYGKYFPHSSGHGVGLEVHELPVLRKTTEGVLEKNMVVTIEPGIYVPGLGGIRLEDTIVITEGGCRLFA